MLLFLFADCSKPPEIKQPTARLPFFFVQLTDPQFGYYTNDNNCLVETRLFEQAIQHCNRLHPAFVVVTGDLINRPCSDKQADAILAGAAHLDSRIPIFWVPGNHDIDESPSPESLRWYREWFGPDRFSFEVDGYLFIVLNSTLIEKPGAAPQEAEAQDAWLAGLLQETKNRPFKPKVFFMHHPLLGLNPRDRGGLDQHRYQNYLNLFTDHGVSAMFTGHFHRNRYGRIGEMEVVVTSSLGKPRGDEPSGLRIVRVFPDHIDHQFYALEAVSDKVSMNSATTTAPATGAYGDQRMRSMSSSTDSSGLKKSRLPGAGHQ